MKWSPLLAGGALLVVLLVGLPLYLRTPIWVDVTYHDISAKNVLSGGVHYRDVFETNLPGMVWLHCLVRSIVGWSQEAIRVVDLLVFASITFILTRPMRRLDHSSTRCLWFAVAACLFYLGETEFIHVQRDGWMLLPTVLATWLRIRQVMDRDPRSFRWGVLEGFVWGCAVWIKPHALIPAFLVWLISVRNGSWRANGRDLAGLVSGGLLAGGLGSAWLIATGTWSPMWDVMLNWNGEYYEWSWSDTFYKIRLVSMYFAPFSLLHFIAVPLAVYALLRRNAPRAIIAALYLGWLAEATFIQKIFDYAHAPPTLLGIAVLALFRWPVGPIFLVWCIVGGLINQHAGKTAWFKSLERARPVTTSMVLPNYSMLRKMRLEHWSRCWYDSSEELKDELSFYYQIPSAPEWVRLREVANYLRTQNVGDGDVIAWHDSTHPVYLMLNIRPGIRFPHVITVMRMKSKVATIRDEAFRSPAKFVISDTVAIAHVEWLDPDTPTHETNRLPDDFPDSLRNVYPWNQPVVFQAGRYIVHRIDHPHGEIDFPLPGGRKED